MGWPKQAPYVQVKQQLGRIKITENLVVVQYRTLINPWPICSSAGKLDRSLNCRFPEFIMCDNQWDTLRPFLLSKRGQYGNLKPTATGRSLVRESSLPCFPVSPMACECQATHCKNLVHTTREYPVPLYRRYVTKQG